MFKVNSQDCECCEGSGKSQFHYHDYDKEDLETIRTFFPKFNPKESCDECFGKGSTHSLITGMVQGELHSRFMKKFLKDSLED